MIKNIRWPSFLLLCFLSFIFLAFFSVSTSFLYDYPKSIDSHVYQVIGKLWNEGYLPYVDVWDHKGPVIYFINAIGYALTGNKYGVFIIQLFFFSATLVILWDIFRTSMSSKKSWTCIFVYLVALAFCMGDNCVEEYVMPFLILSFYLQYQWITIVSDKGVIAHPPLWATLYGFVFAFSLLTRLTNALGVCAGVGLILVSLLIKGLWRNFLNNILFFVLGFFFLFFPFAFYFYIHDAFDEMWFGTFLYNLDYVGNVDNIVTLQQKIYSRISLVACYFLLTIAIFRFYKRSYFVGVYFFVICISLMSWLYNSNGYLHYTMLSMPFLVLALLDIEKIKKCFDNIINLERFSVFFKTLIVLISIAFVFRDLYKGYHFNCEKQSIELYGKLIKRIPPQERNSFLAYDMRPSVYLYYDVKPGVPFFCNHNFYSYNSRNLYFKMKEALKKQEVKWMIVKKPYTGVFKDELDVLYTEEAEIQMDNKSKTVLMKLKQ